MEMIVDLKEKMEEKIKEACEVIETNISFENNFVIYDKEGVLLNRYGNALEECGYDVRILNLCDFNKSNQYNPLAYVDKPEEVMELAYYIIDNIRYLLCRISTFLSQLTNLTCHHGKASACFPCSCCFNTCI